MALAVLAPMAFAAETSTTTDVISPESQPSLPRISPRERARASADGARLGVLRQQGKEQGNGQGLAAATAGIGNQNFCTKFDSSSKKFGIDLEIKTGDLKTKIETEGEKAKFNRQNADAKLQQNRDNGLKNRQAIYAKLTSKAGTDEQKKQAVATFQTTIEAAVVVREAAIDAARATYRQSFDQLVSQHQSTSAGVLATFQTAIQTAITQASSQCSTGVAPASVKETFQSAMASARAARQAGVGQADDVALQLKQLSQTRDGAIQSATLTYQIAMKAAAGALRTAFGEVATDSAAQEAGSGATK
ncbi:MAG: hypothetical protein WCF93_05795 [Candidatus Moraniibacteriota bacterium]